MGWPCLRTELRRLSALRPSPLLVYPSLDDDTDRDLPVHVTLAPWALDAAAGLDTTFGADIEIIVGFLHYPTGARRAYPGTVLRPPQHYPTMDPDELGVALRAPLDVPSGRDLWATVELSNRSGRAVTVVTNGHLTGRVVDRHGEGVGGSPRPETLPRVTIRIDPHDSHPVNLAVGTASLDPALGYAVPPGRWGVDFLLRLDDGQQVRSPALPLTVTDPTT